MAKKKVEKKVPKNKDFSFYVLNIKIMSDDIATGETYSELFENAFKNKQMGKINADHHGIIRQLFHDKDAKFIYGIFCRFVKVGNQAMDINSLEIIDFEIPRHLFPNPKEAQFVFFPDLHRVGIFKNSKISLSSLQKMLTDLFNADKEKNMAVEVNIEQSSDAFEKILAAKEIQKVHIEVSPSNADINNDATAFMDKELKETGIAKIAADIHPNAGGKLKTEKGTVLIGMFGLAQSNGKVRATIVNDQEKKEVVNTESHPRVFKISSESAEGAKIILKKNLAKWFRNGK